MSFSTAHKEERAELDAVLASAVFTRAPRQAKLLEYICKEYFSGREQQIKEYNLATEVLGRSAEFDQSRDAIVRVEFFRLRKKLKDYYEGEGAGHALRIVVHPGQYVPQFVRRDEASYGEAENDLAATLSLGVEAAEESENPAPPSGPKPGHGTRWIILVSAFLVAAIVFLARQPRVSTSKAPEGTPAPPSSVRAAPPPASVTSPDEVRILAGYFKGNYTDRAGQVWQSDRYYDGGDALEQTRQFITRTLDPTMFQTFRSGPFSYDIPLKPGTYELRLYFAETHYGPDTLSGGGETSRLFDVEMNGKPLLHIFDIIKDAAGNNVADVRAFKDVSPAPDGKLHLRFRPLSDAPVLNAIEIVPAPPGRINPIRIVAQDGSYTDHDGHVWEPDRYASGGQLAVHIHRTPVSGTTDPDLYVGQRYGNFNYAIPVPPGQYAVTLRFAETYWGLENQRPGAAVPGYSGAPEGGVGSRVFDVYSNGQTLLKNFDIFKEAGAGRALDKTFHGLEPNAEGKIVLSFVPVLDYACINAIEVRDESK
ncbi:MAG TPA: malectin domain-containing carbohydrate-binding protein [Terriglobales bacterium]